MNIEELAEKFVVLAKKSALTKLEHAEAQKLMGELKKAGMSNTEISKLSSGRWSFTTIKGYTTSIKASKSSPWPDAISLLNALISNGMSLDDVDTVLTIDKDLKSRGIGLDDVVEVFLAADSASMDVAAVTQQIKQLKESGLSITSVGEAIELKGTLEEAGFSLDSLPALVSLAQKYDSPTKLLEAVDAYTSLKEIHAQTAVAKKELEDVKVEVTTSIEKMQETEKKTAELQKPIQAYSNALNLGFGEKELTSIVDLTNKFGGPRQVFKALKMCTNITELTDKVSSAKSKLVTLDTTFNQLETKHSHMITAVDMCETLIHKYKLGMDAIAQLLSLAGKHGEAVEIFRAMEAYENIIAMKQELTKLEGKVYETQNLLAKLEGQHETIQKHLDSLCELALKVGAKVGKVQAEFAASDTPRKTVELINNPGLANYVQHSGIVLTIAIALRKFVLKNEDKFKSAYAIKAGLADLIKDLGGIS